MIDIEALRYQWFDSVFKNAPRPALLQDKVNYEVMGANVWKHAPSVDAMSNTRLRFYLNGKKLDARQPPSEAATTLTVDLADRSDVKRQAPGGGVQDRAIDTWNGIEFVSDPLPAPVEMSGLISGVLDFTANKKDFDFEIDTYELTPSGDYIQIPPYWARASYVRDLTQRHLLTPNARQRLPFKAVRLASLRMSAGSRVVAVLSIIKGTDRQINYGTGKDVNDETIKDAGAPLKIDFFSSSYIDLPVREAASR
jgi:predicted acyl esterase